MANGNGNGNNGNNRRRRRGRPGRQNSSTRRRNRTLNVDIQDGNARDYPTGGLGFADIDKQSISKDAAKVKVQVEEINRDGVVYDSQGLTTVSLRTIKQRLQLEQTKANYFQQRGGSNISAQNSNKILNGNSPVSITPAKISLGSQEYNMLSSTELFNSKKMMKLAAQMKTIAQDDTDRPLNNYNDLFGENASTNASIIDSLSLNNIALQKRRVTNTGNSRDSRFNESVPANEGVNINEFSDIPSNTINKCLIDHFISPREHLGIQTHFLRENLLIEDITKDDCNNCTIEGFEENYGDVDLSSLSVLAMPQDLLKTMANLSSVARQATAGGGGDLMENIFDEEAPAQIKTVYDSLRITAATDSSESSTEDAESAVAVSIALSLYASMIQYIDVFMGYMVAEPDDSGVSIKLMKSPIFTVLTEELLQSLETVNLPVLCRFRPYAAPYESFELEFFEDFEPPLLDALPMFNSCFLLHPGQLSEFVSTVNPAVQIDLYTEGCELYYIAGDGLSQEYVGSYHIHYDGTIMSEGNHNPEVDHDVLYRYCDTPTPNRPDSCDPCPEWEGGDDGTRIDPEDDPRGGFYNNFITNLDDTIRGYFRGTGESKSGDYLEDEIKEDAGTTQDEMGGSTGGLGSGGPGGPSGGGAGY